MGTADQEAGSADQEDGFREIKTELTISRQKYYRNNRIRQFCCLYSKAIGLLLFKPTKSARRNIKSENILKKMSHKKFLIHLAYAGVLYNSTFPCAIERRAKRKHLVFTSSKTVHDCVFIKQLTLLLHF